MDDSILKELIESRIGTCKRLAQYLKDDNKSGYIEYLKEAWTLEGILRDYAEKLAEIDPSDSELYG